MINKSAGVPREAFSSARSRGSTCPWGQIKGNWPPICIVPSPPDVVPGQDQNIDPQEDAISYRLSSLVPPASQITCLKMSEDGSVSIIHLLTEIGNSFFRTSPMDQHSHKNEVCYWTEIAARKSPWKGERRPHWSPTGKARGLLRRRIKWNPPRTLFPSGQEEKNRVSWESASRLTEAVGEKKGRKTFRPVNPLKKRKPIG